MNRILYTLLLIIGICIRLNAQPLFQYANTYYPSIGNGDEKGVSVDYDDAGNAYITGITDANGNNDIITIKYSPSGTKLWEAIFSGTGNGDDQPVKIKYANNKVYVAGYTKSSGTGYDWVTICYNATGSGIQTEAWKAIYNDSYNGDDKATDMEIDGGGNIYVGGSSYDNNTKKLNACLIKYNGISGVLIRSLYEGEGSSYDVISKELSINSGNNILFHTSRINYQYSYQASNQIYTLDSSFTQFGSVFKAISSDNIRKIIPDVSHYYIIIEGGAGTSLAKIPNGGGSYSAVWLTGKFGAPNPTYTNVYDYDLDDYGNPYVLWYDTISGGTAVNTYKWAKLNSSTGDTIFTRVFNPSNAIDRPLQLKVGHQSTPTVYITGNSVVSGKLQNFTVGYSSSTGNALWTLNQSCPSSGNKSIADMQLDNYNNIYLTGASSCTGNTDLLALKYCATLPVANAGADKSVCQGSTVQLGSAPIANYLYSWSPSTGLSNSNVSNPLASPTTNTVYVLTVTSPSGCTAKDTINLTVLNNCPVCTAPTGLSATTTQNSATVSWNSIASAISYTLQYKATAASDWSDPVTISSTSYLISGLACNTQFQWKVLANCSATNSSTFSSSTFTTNGCVGGLPNLNQSTASLTVTANSINISATVKNDGNASSVACRVGYYVSTDPTFNTGRILVGSSAFPALPSGGSSTVSAIVNLCGLGLSNNTTYYIGYYIDDQAVVSESTEGDNIWYWSNGPTIILYCNLIPANDKCSGVTTLSCGSSISGATTYATSTNDPTTTCVTSPGAPGVWYKVIGNGKIMTASLCGSSYDTKIQIYSGSCSNLTCVTGNDDTCSVQSLATWLSSNGITYYIFVYGYSDNVGDFQLDITCSTSTAVKNTTSIINKIEIYPNPASQNVNINIQSHKNANIQLRIFDAGGKEMFTDDIKITKGEILQKIDVSNFAKGMYIIQLTGEDGIVTDKFMVE